MNSMNDKSLLRIFLRYSIPTIVGLFLTSFIIVVDGFFIGWKMGENGLAAVNMTLPVLYILLAVTTMIGVGGVTLANQSLGAKQPAAANYYFSVAVTSVLAVTAFFVASLALFTDQVVTLLGAAGVIRQFVKDFLGMLTYFYLFSMLNIVFSMFIRAEGKPQLSLVFSVAGNIINILLDYLFIIRLEWGMSGAALASGIAVLLPCLFGLGYFLTHRSVCRLCRFSPDLGDFKAIMIIGSAEFIAQISISVTTAVFNWVLLARLGVNGVAALTIIGYIFFIHSMVITGIAVGIHPVISYHYGAKNIALIFGLLKIAFTAVTAVGVLIFAVASIWPEGVVGLFAHGNTELLELGRTGLRYAAAAFLLNGYNFIATVFLTSVGRPKAAAVVCCLRSLVLLLVFLMVLPKVIGDKGIWLTMPAAETVTFGIACLLVNGVKAKMAGAQEPVG